ncbi:MAG: hypothetical protein EA382_19275 [Spirochaetaceae bacterium]|nr:MAG: hypothetical protein EA382_19275 [Spirochaetaceae bacterium]
MVRPRLFYVALLAAAAALIVTGSVFGQSNTVIDAILGEEVATAQSAAYLAMTSAGLVADDATPAVALRTAREEGWIGDRGDREPVTFGEYAYLMMRAHGVSGGLMYLIFPGPRYAAREFTYRGWSPERRAPGELVSGEFMVRVTGNMLEMVGGER